MSEILNAYKLDAKLRETTEKLRVSEDDRRVLETENAALHKQNGDLLAAQAGPEQPELFCGACIIAAFVKANEPFTAYLSGEGVSGAMIHVEVNGKVPAPPPAGTPSMDPIFADAIANVEEGRPLGAPRPAGTPERAVSD